MVLFFNCGDDDDGPVLYYKESKIHWMLCETPPSSGEQKPLSPSSGTNQQASLSFLMDSWSKVEHFKGMQTTHWNDKTSTLIQPHQLNGLFSSQGQTRSCTNLPLREQKSRRTFTEPVTCCTVCFVRRYVNTKDKHTLSRAGLLRYPSGTNRTEEITERQTALALMCIECI